MASPRRHSTLIELIRDRPSSIGASTPVRVDRVKPDTGAGMRGGGGGFDVASLGKLFSAGRRLNLPMGYVFIAVALIFASWIGMYMIGYSRAAGVSEADRVARLTTTADPLLSENDKAPGASTTRRSRSAEPATVAHTPRPTPRVSSDGPTGTGLPIQRSSSLPATATANRPASVLPAPEFDPNLNYWIIANYHEDQARQAALFLIDYGVPATVIRPSSKTAWQVVGLTGFSREAYRAGEHHEYVKKLERLGATWEKEFNGPDNFGQMYPIKGQNLLKGQ
jgi:hypothetical protein